MKKIYALIILICLGSFALASDIRKNYQEIVKFGPRPVESLSNFHVRNYLEKELRKVGYKTRRESFYYKQRKDRRSIVKSGEVVLHGRGFLNSVNGVVDGVIARVKGVGTANDLSQVNVRGKIAVIKRGTISFERKIQNAKAAGAIAVVVINNQDQNFRGILSRKTSFPVIGLKESMWNKLKNGQKVKVKVNMFDKIKQGTNILAFQSSEIQPKVLFGAHFDSVSVSPGVSDNLSGVITLLDVARQIKDTEVAEQSHFVFFDAEEEGLQGSYAYVKKHADQIGRLKAMVNLDMVGVNVHPLKLKVSHSLLKMANYLNIAEVNQQKLVNSDHIPFEKANVPYIVLHRGLDQNSHRSIDRHLDIGLIRENSNVVQRITIEILSQIKR